MIKFWIISLAAVPLVAWLFSRVPQKIVSQLVTGGTEQILVQWRDSLAAYKKDHGKFPEQVDGRNFGESLLDAMTGKNEKGILYLNPATVRFTHTMPVDGWDNMLTFDPLQNGEFSRVRSNGPDGIYNTPDDIDSTNLLQRNLAAPEDPNEDRPKSKSKSVSKNSDTSPDPEPEP